MLNIFKVICNENYQYRQLQLGKEYTVLNENEEGYQLEGLEGTFDKRIFKTINKPRVDKGNYYLNIAETVLERGTCLRRNFGAVIVKNDEIISTGYTGSPRGEANCCDIGKCKRQELNIARGERYELCRSVHAEQNAVISASRKDMIDSVLYLVGKEANGQYVKDIKPCDLCNRFIKNAGIKKIIVRVTRERFKELE